MAAEDAWTEAFGNSAKSISASIGAIEAWNFDEFPGG
jgi:hypothetical protein